MNVAILAVAAWLIASVFAALLFSATKRCNRLHDEVVMERARFEQRVTRIECELGLEATAAHRPKSIRPPGCA